MTETWPVTTKAACCLLIAALISTPVAAQQHRGSPEDQAACTPDVYRLCAQEIPDEDDIVACLIRKKRQLSPACFQVFSRPDVTAPPKSDDDD